jgi:hypothetical protein
MNARFDARVVKVGPGGGLRLPALSSGFAALDLATGLGGFPRGRISELIGRPTAGRETVAARSVALAEGYSAWVDVPGLVEWPLAHCAVDLERLFILRPEHVRRWPSPPAVAALVVLTWRTMRRRGRAAAACAPSRRRWASARWRCFGAQPPPAASTPCASA